MLAAFQHAPTAAAAAERALGLVVEGSRGSRGRDRESAGRFL
jgi:hypothetical protein